MKCEMHSMKEREVFTEKHDKWYSDVCMCVWVQFKMASFIQQ
jgi:hypothetical protein